MGVLHICHNPPRNTTMWWERPVSISRCWTYIWLREQETRHKIVTPNMCGGSFSAFHLRTLCYVDGWIIDRSGDDHVQIQLFGSLFDSMLYLYW